MKGGLETRLVYTLSIDLIESTLEGIAMTQRELDRFNRALVAQIEPHLDALGFEDLLAKFTGDGWLLMSPELHDAERLCALAAIMKISFHRDIEERTGLSRSRIPDLRMALCSGRDIRIHLWHGSFDWVGDSARRAARSAQFAYPNEVLIDASVNSLVMRDFVTSQIDPGVRPTAPKRLEEDIPLWALGELRIEAAEDWETAAAYVYALGQVGRTEDAAAASLRAADRLESEGLLTNPEPGSTIGRWNRLISTAPTYEAVLDLWRRLEECGARPNLVTLNTLIERSPSHDEIERWTDTLTERGIRLDATTYRLMIGRAPDFDAALKVLSEMDSAGVEPDAEILEALVARAPTYRAAVRLVRMMLTRDVRPTVEIFRRLIAKAPGYDVAIGVLDLMDQWRVAPDVSIFNRLVQRAPSYDDAVSWLETMAGRSVMPDITTFNTLIARAGRYGAAVGWLDDMEARGVRPDVSTFNVLVSRAPDYEVAVALLRRMPERGVRPNSETYKTLIGHAPHYGAAVGWLDDMRTEGIRPNNEVYKALIEKAPDYDSAVRWLNGMGQAGVAPNTETYRTLMSKAPDLLEALNLLDNMAEHGVQATSETFKTLVGCTSSSDEALDVIARMPAAGVRATAEIYQPLIAGAPSLQEARAWLDHMYASGVEPTTETLTAVLRKSSTYDEAEVLLDTMRTSIEPNEGAYRVLVELSPDMLTAQGWVEEMREEGMRPSAAILEALLGKDPGDISAQALLDWYLSLDYHPAGPMAAAIDSYVERGSVQDALRLTLDYPHLEAARQVFADHGDDALVYFNDVVSREPGHPNGRYAMGLALIEAGKPHEALTHLEVAMELARPGPRVAALDEIIRSIRSQLEAP